LTPLPELVVVLNLRNALETGLRILEKSTEYTGKILAIPAECGIIGHDDDTGFRFEDAQSSREGVGDDFDPGHVG
jgi:hypothetical protein